MRRFLFVLLAMGCLWSGSPAWAAVYALKGDVVGEVAHYTTQEDDNLYEIARRFDLGIVEILSANPGVDPWMPEPGTKLVLTTQHILPPVREGIVLNLSELRLFYFMPGRKVMVFPIGIGREGWQTPLGETEVVQKRKDPVWIPTDSIREEDPNLPAMVLPGPDNPLGAYALNLDMPGIRIHGTNRLAGVGKRSSHGCIRMYPEDIETLFHVVKVGTKVTIIDMPYRLGWRGDTLYLEVMPTQEQADLVASYRRPMHDSDPEIYDMIQNEAGDVEIDWYAVDDALNRRSGIPVTIGRR